MTLSNRAVLLIAVFARLFVAEGLMKCGGDYGNGDDCGLLTEVSLGIYVCIWLFMPFVVIVAPMLYYKCKEDGFTPPSIRAPRVPTPNFRANRDPAASLSSPSALTTSIEMVLGGGGGDGGDTYKWAKSLKTLVDMGFEEAQAKQALEDTNGNERDALTKLIEQP
mmetsp:Transcript_35562/g.82340  ORF Transcript_35562/g.82340 Transcript_35562/m.82340 type:complete len:165 (-) Transcript_35562:219-713(-)|eukprot:CAMPEP_0182567218 /NCGR_PEP_ID=MMETSP1324-20130603/8495_1 /TAXON_ID=236786 /ORGANISM="Florenciella sp., Strain RCC1587" /LENGTH=164 /DNA_ID=CAMNT_0024781173 /DNA_START=57 /DNA_END=551 /DNA_ORIENTATION=-